MRQQQTLLPFDGENAALGLPYRIACAVLLSFPRAEKLSKRNIYGFCYDENAEITMHADTVTL
jgi:hypothetical protein